ncbi:DUF4272 domain-containing protein [Pirellulaceae bacterium SH449]
MSSLKPILEDARRCSIEFLHSRRVPVMDSLPLLEISDERNIRSIEEIANRAIATCIVYSRSQGMSRDDALTSLRVCQAEYSITTKELEFVNCELPAMSSNVQYSWIVESYWVLLWVLRFIPTLSEPTMLCDVKLAESILRERGATRFRGEASLRDFEEIVKFADLYYRYHWAVVDSPSEVQKLGIVPGVVVERDRAFTWLLSDLDWDDVELDT